MRYNKRIFNIFQCAKLIVNFLLDKNYGPFLKEKKNIVKKKSLLSLKY